MPTGSNIILNKIISALVKTGASRLHLEIGTKPVIRLDQKLVDLDDEAVVNAEFLKDVVAIVLSPAKQQELSQKKSAVTTYTFEGKIRFKVHAFYQKNSLSLIFTYIPSVISNPLSIGLTQELIDLTQRKSGLIIISGYHSSGRTSTALSLLNYINTTRAKYILTLEKPIEYILTSQKSIIEQREIGRDADDFIQALDFSKESDVDTVFISEIADYATLKAVLALVSSGRLVIAIAQGVSAADSLAELAAMAPKGEADKTRRELAEHLLAVVVQQLVPRRGGGQINVAEILISNAAVAALIVEGRYSQLTSIIQTSRDEGMRSLDQALLELVKTNEVDYAAAHSAAINKDNFAAAAHKFSSSK